MTSIKQGYKQTKVGIIPEDWEVVSLNDGVIFLDHKRKPLKDEDRQKIQGSYPYYGASGIIDYVNDYIFDEELILIGEDGANIIDRSSRLVFLVNGKYWVNNHAHVLKAKANLNNYFLCEYLESLKYDKYNTGTAQPKLNKEIVSNIPIIKPPLKEQEKIAEILTTWDEAISLHVKLIEEKEQLKIGLMQKLLSGEVRFSGFCDEWKKVKLGDICNITTGTSKSQFIGEGDYYVIDMGSVSSTGNLIASKKTALQKDLLQKGDLIMPKDDIGGGQIIGKVALIEEDNKYILGDHVFKIVTKQNSRFLLYKINSFEVNNNLKRKVTGSAQLGLNKKNVEDLQIYLPSLPEQQRIAEVLSFADDAINLLKKELEELKQQKKGLMQKLLTGEVRVNV